jgi:hypothetical protein
MTKFATIELYTGYVWWVGEADDALDACHQSHAESGNDPLDFEEVYESETNDTAGGYAVYEVPADFDVTDGQDANQIAATESHCLVGFFRAR